MSQAMDEETSAAQDRVAVIAVHGVGDQLAASTAREIVGLLQAANRDAAGRPLYGPFEESRLDLAVAPRRMKRAPVPAGVSPSSAAAATPESGDIAFTRRALEGVNIEEKDSRYATTVLSGLRRGAGRTSRIDVFEFYWADLSRLGEGLLHVLGSLYQLLFHLASLGRKTVGFATEATPTAALRSVRKAQDAAEGMIGAVVPVLNLFMLCAVLPVFVVVLAPKGSHAVLAGLVCGAVAAYLTYRALHRSLDEPGGIGGAPILPIVMFGAVTWAATAYLEQWGAIRAAFFTYSALLLALGWYLARLLHRRRDTDGRWLSATMVTAGAATALWLGFVALRYFGRGLPEGLADAVRLTLFLTEGFLGTVELAWYALVLVGWWMCISGWIAGHSLPPHHPNKRAIWTGQMGAFLPAGLFLTLTMVIWSVVLAALPSRLDGKEFGYAPWIFGDVEGGSAATFASHLLDEAAGPGFNAFVLCLFVALLIAVSGMAPSIAAEIKATTGKRVAEARRLGAWLDRGFKAIRIAGYLMLFGWLLILPGIELAFWLFPGLWEEKSLAWLIDPKLLHLAGGAIVGAVGVVLTLRNILFQSIGKVVDIGLDVDNWLKERPLKSNPRGRILTRYLALLDHVCRDPVYKRVVIVAHSQGTVISVDLLRFLKRHPEATPQNLYDSIPIRLATFGCPLYQLYSLRFPHLYGWVRNELPVQSSRPGWEAGRPPKSERSVQRQSAAKPAGEGAPTPPAETGSPKALGVERPQERLTGPSPDAAELGVQGWYNGFRTGDYVGRFVATPHPSPLWVPDTDIPAWRPGRAVIEYCVGAGAHTHYFDETACDVGLLLDGLIADE